MAQPLAASVDIGNSIQQTMNSVADFVPQLVAFIVIMIIGWIIAKVVEKAAVFVLGKVHFDRLGERGVIGDTLERSNTSATRVVAKLLFWAIILIALQVAFGSFGPNPISALLGTLVNWLPQVAIAVILIIVAAWIAKGAKNMVQGALSTTSYGRLVGNLVAAFIVGLGAIAALNQIHVAVTVTMPILITVLATMGGIAVVALGGGAIRPMEQRWERWLGTAERENANRTSSAFQRGREDAMRGGGTPAEQSMTEESETGRQPG